MSLEKSDGLAASVRVAGTVGNFVCELGI
jgi:hypothetical protein